MSDSPGRRWKHHLARAAQVAGAAATLIGTSALLLLSDGVARVAPRHHREGEPTSIKTHHEQSIDNYVVITGTVSPPYSPVELLIDDSQAANTYAGTDGTFRLVCTQRRALPKHAVLRLGRGDATAEVSLSVSAFVTMDDPPPPELAFAYYLADRNLLWAAGVVGSTAAIDIGGPGPFPCEQVSIYPDGIAAAFEVTLDCDTMPASQVRLKTTFGDVSAWQPVQVVRGDDVPLKRRVEMHVREHETDVLLEVTLPKKHPVFDQTVRGIRDPATFAQSLLGFAYPPYFPSSSPETKSVPVFEIDGDRGVYRWSYTEGYSASFVGLAPTRSGMSSHLLLTAGDVLQVDFKSRTPLSFRGRVPGQLSDGKAVWRGPAAGHPEEIQVVFTPKGIEDSERALQERQKRTESPAVPEEKTLPEFIRGFERPEGTLGSIFAGAWRMLLGLIPFLGLLWLSRRTFLRSVPGWGTFRAGLIVLAVWSSWPLLCTIVTRLLDQVRWALMTVVNDQVWARADVVAFASSLRATDQLPFLISLVVVTGFIPAWAKRVALPPFPPPRSPASSRILGAVSSGMRTASVIAAAVPLMRAVLVALQFDSAVATLASWINSKPQVRVDHALWITTQVLWSLLLLLCSVGLSASALVLSAVRQVWTPRSGVRSLWRAIAGGLPILPGLVIVVVCVHVVKVLLAEHQSLGWAEAGRALAELTTRPNVQEAPAIALVAAGMRLALMFAIGISAAALIGALRGSLGLLAALFSGYFVLRSLPILADDGRIAAALPDLVKLVKDADFIWVSEQKAVFFAGCGALGLLAFWNGLRGIVPPSVKGKHVLPASIVLVGTTLFASQLPARIALGVASAAIVVPLGLVTWSAVAGLRRPMQSARPRLGRWHIAILLLVVGVIVWPFEHATAAAFDLNDIAAFAREARQLLTYVPAVGLIVILSRALPAASIHEMRLIGTFFFAVVLVNPATTWMYVPLPFGLAILIAWYALFRSEDDVASTRARVDEAGPRSEDAVKKVVAAAEIRRRLAAVYRTLSDQFQKLTLTPADYDRRVGEYREYERQHTAEEGGAADRARAVFAWGSNNRGEEGIVALTAGGVLAAGPFLLALYQYLPGRKLYHPFAIAELLTLFGYAARTWLLAAFFIGYFMPYLRGNTGLGKGVWVFASLAVTYALDRLVAEPSIEAMKLVFAWSVQAFLFCSLLGLFVMDYRLVRRAGYGPRKLLDVHELPTLSAYASTLLAAIVPTVTGIIAGGFGNAVKLLVESILPHAK